MYNNYDDYFASTTNSRIPPIISNTYYKHHGTSTSYIGQNTLNNMKGGGGVKGYRGEPRDKRWCRVFGC